MNWYSKCRRVLPWRFDPTPYRVWISEIMLQQTQVAVASSYYVRFVKHFPDLESLANASEEEILLLWAGLGYYHRARNLSQAAREIYSFHNGVFPDDFKTILSLPGIGRYTAGAICSLAFNQPQPIVDGNIRRVITRFNGITDRVPEKYFWGQMETWIPDGKASIFNQAMMELGALVCTPIQPHCAECPIRTSCRAHKMNLQTRLPHPTPRRPVHKFSMIILLLKRKNKLLLTNEIPAFIPGAWGFPSRLIANDVSIKDAALHLSQDILGESILLSSGAKISHTITNRRIAAHLFTGDVRYSIRLATTKFSWIDQSRANEILTSSLFLKALKKIANKRCRQN
jgi:A/G-specific adenine glycosylase